MSIEKIEQLTKSIDAILKTENFTKQSNLSKEDFASIYQEVLQEEIAAKRAETKGKLVELMKLRRETEVTLKQKRKELENAEKEMYGKIANKMESLLKEVSDFNNSLKQE